MSAFVDNVEAKDLRMVKPKYSPIKTMITPLPQDFSMEWPSLRGYEISTSYHQRFFCDPKDVDRMITNAKRMIKEHIYGSLRIKLLELERDVTEGDDLKCRILIGDILKEVFEA